MGARMVLGEAGEKQRPDWLWRNPATQSEDTARRASYPVDARRTDSYAKSTAGACPNRRDEMAKTMRERFIEGLIAAGEHEIKKTTKYIVFSRQQGGFYYL